ncbi:MAG: LuxR C-terminal-related transcriptional regulator [Elainellaceae cyanobacterium]
MAGGIDKETALSERELQIVELVTVGLTNQEVAEKLDISKRTVDNHVSNILTKTSTGNRVELVRWARRWGKVCLDQVNCCTLPIGTDASLAEPASDIGTPLNP